METLFPLFLLGHHLVYRYETTIPPCLTGSSFGVSLLNNYSPFPYWIIIWCIAIKQLFLLYVLNLQVTFIACESRSIIKTTYLIVENCSSC